MGRPSKTAARKRQVRAAEDSPEREERLNKIRKIQKDNRSNEEEDQRKARLLKLKEYNEHILSREKVSSKASRLEKIRARLNNESDEEYARRLSLIHERLSKESDEEYARRLSLIHERLSKESDGEYTRRISAMREKSRERLSKESDEEYARRIASMREKSRERLSKESNVEYARRVSLIHERLSKESGEEYARRLSLIHERLSKESDEEYAHRLSLIHERLSKESEEEYAHRLSLISVRLSDESAADRSRRLSNVKRRNSQILQNETAEQKKKRLSAKQKDNKNRRPIFDEFFFDNEINVFADEACRICNKSLYPQQRKVLHITTYSHLSTMLPAHILEMEDIVTCSRCFNLLKKRKVPSQAVWNNMEVLPVPQEIAELTEVEQRMLCRIIPFLKIIRVKNRFSQDWCKGQVVLFAQDVVELAEQLPIPLQQTGMFIVSENLENLQKQRHFQIDINRLKRGLEWLLINNVLYRDVRASFASIADTNILDIVQAIDECNTDDVPQTDLEVDGNVIRSENKYEKLNEHISILRGSFNQSSERFDIESRGKQCTGIAAIACVAFHLIDPIIWCISDVDYILIVGDKYYRDCMLARINPDEREINVEYLAATELLSQVTFNNCRVHIDVKIEEAINGNIDLDRSQEGFPNLINGLNSLFKDHSYGILTANSISVAVAIKNDAFWLFDSHSRGPKGCTAAARGTSCCMRFTNVEDLHNLVRRNLYAKSGNEFTRNVYSITPIAIEAEERSAGSQQQQQQQQQQSISQQSSVLNRDTSGNNYEHVEQVETSMSCQPVLILSTTMLRSIDEGVPDMKSIVSVRNNPAENQPVKLVDLRRKTAPPLSLEREKRMEELGWFFLFPNGRNGFGEEREITITPLDYFQARVMAKDKRFQRTDYLFFALSVVEYFRAKSSVSVSCRMRQGEHTPQGLVDNIHLTMRNVRGSASYWRRCCSELVAMVRSLGPPTWFVTFSCNDMNWPDMLKALLIADGRPTVEVDGLTFAERLSLVQKYPVIVSRQFMVRVNALMRFLKHTPQCLGGEVVDSWYRIEFQNRGSPHLHMLVWCDNVPDFLTVEGQKVIEEVISCSLKKEDSTLNKLVEDVQIHKHTETCYKDRNCRFGFPRPIRETTTCLGPDETLANNGRFCLLKRTAEETMVNNYNPRLLKMWAGNMDIQPCGNVTAVAYYIAKYASKCEPHDAGEVVRQAISKAKRQGGTIWKQLFSVSMAILSQRLVSAPECAFRLCHLPLKMSSRKAVFINSCRPAERYRLLRFEDDETSVFNNIFDRYEKRPDELENLSLAEFAVRYETVSSPMWSEEDEGDAELRSDDPIQSRFIKLRDNTRMRIRTKAAVLRHRYFTINSDREAYFYNLIVCHIPFRNENELTFEDETAENCFLRRQHELKPLVGNVSAEEFTYMEQIIQQALAQAVALNAVRRVLGEVDEVPDVDDPPNVNGDEDVVVEGNDDFVEEEGTIDMPNETFLNNIQNLNVQQRKLFKEISSVTEEDLSNKDTEQMLHFITGGAGSGKTFLLKLIVEHIKRCYAPTIEALIKPVFVEVASLTGVAARQIFGKTLHSIFSLPIEKGNAINFRRMTGQRLEQERRKWRSIKWLIIDEISMVSYENLRFIHLRMQEFKNNEKLFGGVNVLLFGDIMQLPPVKGHWCFVQPPWCSAEINLWHLFSFCELNVNMRQKGDADFIDLLNNLRFGELTTAQLQLLCERKRIPLTGEFGDGEAVRIFPTIKLVNEYNSKMTDTMSKSCRIYTVNAMDESREPATYGKKPPQNVIPVDVNNCGGLLHTIQLAEGSRVMLRRNILISDGLVNGVMGVVKKFKWPALRRDQLEEGELPSAVLIKFDDDTVGTRTKDADGYVAIAPITATFQATKGYGDVERLMLPLILSWAVTVHKLQGTTLDRAVIDLGKKIFAKGQVYVALSRVKNLSGLALSDLEPNRLLNRPHDLKAFTEMQRLRSLQKRGE